MLTRNARAYAAGTHRLATFALPSGEIAISINNVAGAAGDMTTLSTWYEAVPTPGTVTLGADNDLSSVRDWAVIAVSIKPAAAVGNAAPTVSLTSPANNAVFTAPASIVLTADAQDSDGTVAQVEFFQGATLVATDTTAPFTFTLTNVAAGSYTFTARATDNLGATTTSAAVNVTVNAAAQVFFIHPDHLNTPRLVSDTQGRTVWRWDNNDPFGNNPPNEDPDQDGNQFVFNLRFPGQYHDRESGLAYNYFRDYDPSIGRYVQSDPVGLTGGLNTYLYVFAGPLANVDPQGLFSCTYDPTNFNSTGCTLVSKVYTDRELLQWRQTEEDINKIILPDPFYGGTGTWPRKGLPWYQPPVRPAAETKGYWAIEFVWSIETLYRQNLLSVREEWLCKDGACGETTKKTRFITCYGDWTATDQKKRPWFPTIRSSTYTPTR